MIRTILRPNKSEITLKIPEKYIGKEVELIAFIKEEAENDFQSKTNPFTMTASEEALGKIWLLEEEDIAWQYLQKDK